ncbi:MAG: type II secretion system minor pseudopilin GspJ [Burkholderiales bacterium]
MIIHPRTRGFTLIELLTALLILALLALLSYRSLSAVLDTREHVSEETGRWQDLAFFFERFERDVDLSAPRPVRDASGAVEPAWLGTHDASGARLEFSRFASVQGIDAARRIVYVLNNEHQIELQIWPGLDVPQRDDPARYVVLRGVAKFDLAYLNANLQWVNAWPDSPLDAPIPRAVRVRIVLQPDQTVVRVFSLVS